jgi:glyoxylase-like metal-dependent hydrolase (beta-lactamase superfamily II)
MAHPQVPVTDAAEIGVGQDDGTLEAAPDLAYRRLAIVNVVYQGRPGAGDGEWVLIDAGVQGTAGLIAGAAEERFGGSGRPACIVLTHGHFDHVGALRTLAERWDVPIYAHPLEHPFLDGRMSYPPPDPSVGGGLMSALSRFYPRGPIDVSPWLRPLPEDGTVTSMAGWRWVPTPGHVSLWRESDRALIAGDAFITTRQESAYAVATQAPELHGPPMYFTTDWESARSSVERLAGLQPELVITGHGRALHGPEMREALHRLARDFDRVAVPEQGRYVESSAECNG